MSSSIPKEIIELARELANKYESADFLKKDPSQFMHRFEKVRDIEAVAFIAANLAFGRREQILSHVEQILSAAGNSPSEWILSKKYENFFPENEKSFYRMYTNRDMRAFFDGLRAILEESETIGEFFKVRSEELGIRNEKLAMSNEQLEILCYAQNGNASVQGDGNLSFSRLTRESVYLHQIIASAFPADCKLLPHSKESAAKKVNMLLRWLVRTNSPVDLGLWTWFDKRDLLMPLDTHVMRQANELGLIQSKSANLRTAVALTKKVAEIFPDDPVRADFALFGLGVSKTES